LISSITHSARLPSSSHCSGSYTSTSGFLSWVPTYLKHGQVALQLGGYWSIQGRSQQINIAGLMGDSVILVKSKHQLRNVIQLTYQILNALKINMHPKKTCLGCIKKGFDFLGVHFEDIPKISNTSLEHHQAKIAQRYAQGASEACIGDYRARWSSWCAGVLKHCNISGSIQNPMPSEKSRRSGCMEHIKEIQHELLYGKDI
jgi:hypothetical protein